MILFSKNCDHCQASGKIEITFEELVEVTMAGMKENRVIAVKAVRAFCHDRNFPIGLKGANSFVNTLLEARDIIDAEIPSPDVEDDAFSNFDYEDEYYHNLPINRI